MYLPHQIKEMQALKAGGTAAAAAALKQDSLGPPKQGGMSGMFLMIFGQVSPRFCICPAAYLLPALLTYCTQLMDGTQQITINRFVRRPPLASLHLTLALPINLARYIVLYYFFS